MQTNLPAPRIRPTALEDIPSLRAMQAASWRATYPNDAAGVTTDWVLRRTALWVTSEGYEKSRQHFKDVLNNQHHQHLVAVVQDKVVGLVHASKIGGKHSLEALYVDSHYYGSGVAQQLMDRAMEWLGGAMPVSLEVASYNQRAIRYYEKNGFKKVESSRHLFADTIPVIEMRKEAEL